MDVLSRLKFCCFEFPPLFPTPYLRCFFGKESGYSPAVTNCPLIEYSEASNDKAHLIITTTSQADSDKRRQDTASAKFLQRPEVKQAVLKIEVRNETKVHVLFPHGEVSLDRAALSSLALLCLLLPCLALSRPVPLSR